jgi:elongator complex protein 4
MSSFKRRGQFAQTANIPGTRSSPSSPSVLTVSTGIPSLDDLLGGGLPLGCVLVLMAPDPHTAYGELVQRHFVAQGLASSQNVCILDDTAMDLAANCMWMHSTGTPGQASHEPDEGATGDGEKSEVKIAWRYENMKKFQTSVTTPSQ